MLATRLVVLLVFVSTRVLVLPVQVQVVPLSECEPESVVKS